MSARLFGLFAAVVTPVHDNGRVDLETLDRIVDHALAPGIAGICVGGATGEYPHFDAEERVAIIRRAASRLPAGRSLLAGIGGATIGRSIALGEAALAAGARALLVPMPMFFRYEQHDLEAFAIEVSRTLRVPLFLYDLPDFTNPLTQATVIGLLQNEEFITGIKDSSGVRDNLGAFATARDGRRWTLLVGNDRLLLEGLKAGWDGTVSGIACFCPSLVLAIQRTWTRGDAAGAAHLQTLLDEVIEQLDILPAPWGIRVALEVLGFNMGSLPLPLSPVRREQIARYKQWLPGWLDRVQASVRG